MVYLLQWRLGKFINMVCNTLQKKFDCVIIIEGNRGLGKSTLAYKIERGVAKEMKHRGSKDYRFNPRHALLYRRKEVISFFHKWRSSGIADEMINVTFNRDFYDEDQKDLIKMVNMNRDHCNLFIACVPQFQTLDNQIKNLCKIRITVVRRGLAVIQTPNRSIYSKDKWDQAVNERIERKWIAKGVANPHYSKLTTFRGILKFSKLTGKQEEKYQDIKNEKRNIVAKEQMGIDIDDEEKVDPYDEAIKLLTEGKIRNSAYLDGWIIAHGKSPESFKKSVARRLKKASMPYKISQYYWDKKDAKQRVDSDNDRQIAELLSSISE